jgi:hypothetical protein
VSLTRTSVDSQGNAPPSRRSGKGQTLQDSWPQAPTLTTMSMTMRGPVDPRELRALPASECAIMLLRDLAQATSVNANNSFRGAEQAYHRHHEPDVPLLLARLSDAWAWLEAHGLLGPDPNAGRRRVAEGHDTRPHARPRLPSRGDRRGRGPTDDDAASITRSQSPTNLRPR